VDISWIVGLAVICPLYYVLMRPRVTDTSSDIPSSPRSTKTTA
jgi:hypothetical protein